MAVSSRVNCSQDTKPNSFPFGPGRATRTKSTGGSNVGRPSLQTATVRAWPATSYTRSAARTARFRKQLGEVVGYNSNATLDAIHAMAGSRSFRPPIEKGLRLYQTRCRHSRRAGTPLLNRDRLPFRSSGDRGSGMESVSEARQFRWHRQVNEAWT